MDYIIDNIDELVSSIPDNFKSALKLLRKQEGGYLHRNKTEADITNGYGIYKYAHPTAELWKYIIDLGLNHGIGADTASWNRESIAKVNSKIDPNYDLYLSYLFYKDYFKYLSPTRFHGVLLPYLISIYANSPVICVKSLKLAINACIDRGYTRGTKNTEDSKVDSILLANLDYIRDNVPEHVVRQIKTILLDITKQQYTKLANNNPAKFGMYLKGWHNRVDSLRNV